MERVVVHYSGRVQGVGFRATVRQIACGYDVTGTVKNLADGRVELIAEATKAELKAFLEGITQSELSGFIAKQRNRGRRRRGICAGLRLRSDLHWRITCNLLFIPTCSMDANSAWPW
jgi:acylphosphatase